jgi:hypothetical protein
MLRADRGEEGSHAEAQRSGEEGREEGEIELRNG